MRKSDDKRRKRRDTYRMLMVVALCLVAGRICSSLSREGNTAFSCANDKSRWCTVAALVEDGSYEIDRLIFSDLKTKRKTPWYTIDLVRHRGKDGELHYYSSKPPLFPTMVAGVYYAVRASTGLSMSQQPIYVPRLVLLLVNLPLALLFMWSTINAIEMICAGEWSRRFLAVATCFGTMLTPFAISLNNHLPAAAATAFIIFIYVKSAEKLDDAITGEVTRISPWLWLLAGIAGGFTVANELPALVMLCLWVVLFLRLEMKSGLYIGCGAALVAAAFFWTNIIAHEDLRPAYAHRDNGALIGTAELVSGSDSRPSLESISRVLIDGKAEQADVVLGNLEETGDNDRWVVLTEQNVQYAINRVDNSSGDVSWTVSHWDDWYDYPNSHWIGDKRRGVDRGEASRLVYFANMTIGHYGIFSITPLWLLLPIAMYYRILHGPRDFRRFVAAVVIATIVCMAFYLMRPEIDRNYGGVSACFRWMLWFAPLWIVVIAPLVDEYSEAPKLRLLMLALLGASVFSVSISLQTPWQSPWIYRFWTFLGWIVP